MTRNEAQTERFQADHPGGKVLQNVGRSVGLPRFRNTNRDKPLYKKRANRLARRAGFMDVEHMLIFQQMLYAAQAKWEAANGGA